jgi:hypothetical protein
MSQNYYFVFSKSEKPPLELPEHNANLGYCAAKKIEGLTGKSSGTLPLSEFADKYWYIAAPGRAFLKWPFDKLTADDETLDSDILTYHYAASTEEVEHILKRGFSVDVLDGPFATRQEAAYSLDLFWEAPGDD